MQTKNHPLKILLAGNGSYLNRGCEAIVRGTMEILRQTFSPEPEIISAVFSSEKNVARQAAQESDSAITHLALRNTKLKRGSRDWWSRQLYALRQPFSDKQYLVTPRKFTGLEPLVSSLDLALAVGGDNYSLDYGWPTAYLALDRYLFKHNIPVLLWGASIGPFDTLPATARLELFRHLEKMPLIFARESKSLAYLRQHVRTKIIHVADPAFLMPSETPSIVSYPPGSIGLNFSPLLAKYVTNNNYAQYVKLCAQIVEFLLKNTEKNILLIPHVTSETGAEDDASLNLLIYQLLKTRQNRICCVSSSLKAAEYKALISDCAVFAGARTHATIAAISSSVPTISLAYSLKAYGINQDVFGSCKYCVKPSDWTRPEELAGRILALLANSTEVQTQLKSINSRLREHALTAGYALRSFTRRLNLSPQ